MARYLVLIYEDEKSYSEGGQDAIDRAMREHTAFGENNAKMITGGNALTPTSTATSIRSDGSGGFVVTDGPFAEVKEALGAYYLIEAEDLDAAIAIAKQVPAPYGGVEVRPVMVFD